MVRNVQYSLISSDSRLRNLDKAPYTTCNNSVDDSALLKFTIMINKMANKSIGNEINTGRLTSVIHRYRSPFIILF